MFIIVVQFVDCSSDRFASCSLLNIPSDAALNVSANRLFRYSSYLLYTREIAMEQPSQFGQEPVAMHEIDSAQPSVTAEPATALYSVIEVISQFLKAAWVVVKFVTH